MSEKTSGIERCERQGHYYESESSEVCLYCGRPREDAKPASYSAALARDCHFPSIDLNPHR